jgi:hypothetical protein
MTLWFVLRVIGAFTKRRVYHACLAVLFFVHNMAFVGFTALTGQSAPGARLMK